MTALTALNKKIFFLSLGGLLAISAFAVVVKAEEAVTAPTTGKTGIQVSAPAYNFGINPGESAQEIIKIRNVGADTQTFYPEVLDFKPAGEGGTPSFIKSNESASYTYSLASWITIAKDPITLKANESAALNFTVNVPKNAEPGGRYAGILFGTTAPAATGTGVAISNKVGSLVLVRIAGDAKEVATLKEFSTPKTSYEKGPVDFVVRVQNSGSVHVIPKGNIEIKNVFGQSVAALPVNEKNGNVLPDSTRRFDKESDNLSWKPDGFTFGRYKAQLLLTYGSPAKTLAGEVIFWIVPWKQLLVIGLAALIVILLLVLGVKRYNRYVVAKALKNQNQPK
jgi:hypothetical protein